MQNKADIGLIGLAVMGANLARNFANREIRTVVYNRTFEKTEEFISRYGNDFLSGEKDLKNLVQRLSVPRKIVIMVQAGAAVDAVLDQLVPLLSKGDTIVDCGNSFYQDSDRRFSDLQKKGIHFVGCGVSGGEEGALHGPSIMPGGSAQSWKLLQPFFTKIAAKDFQGKPCVTHVGNGAAGHYVKMVHNGIEYGVMQMMAEAYDILRKVYGLSAPEIATVFQKLHQGKLNSYLFEIAEKVLSAKDQLKKKGFAVDFILDKAGQKGTGSWTSLEALQQGIAFPTVTEAVFARILSGEKTMRVKLDKLYKSSQKSEMSKPLPFKKFVSLLEDGLYAAMLSTYAQGYWLIQKKSREQNWQVNLAEISRIWEGGCIIRAKILNFLHQAFLKNPEKHLFEIPAVAKALRTCTPSLREIVSLAAKNSISVSGIASALFYFESMTQKNSPANFVQGLRDFFGAHTYERTDREGAFHTEWGDIQLKIKNYEL